LKTTTTTIKTTLSELGHLDVTW